MPMPVKSSCRTRSMRGVGSRGRRICEKGGLVHRKRFGLPRMEEAESAGLIGEFDVLVEGDGALVVLHDVVAAKPVAILREPVFAFGAAQLLTPPDPLTDR